MDNVIWLIVVGTTIWVTFDASRLGARRGALGGGFADIGVVAWFFSCLLLWIVAFPVYLATRPKYRALRELAAATGNGYDGASPQARFGVSDASTYGFNRDRFAHYGETGAVPELPPVGSQAGARTDRVIRLVELRDSGALTQAEFDVMKRDLVGEA